MSRIKQVLIILLTVLISIQFIKPARNENGQVLSADISRSYMVPQNVHAILKTSCYDCHSNHTRYPWYSNIQPGGWLLASHIKKGKAELNFSEFGNYTVRRQLTKLRSITNSLNDNSMPLSSYTLIHTNARLSNNEKQMILSWVEKTRDSLSKR